MHAGLVKVLRSNLHDVSVTYTLMVVEARDLRATDRSTPGDVVAYDFFVDENHLAIDAVMTSLYHNSVLPRVATIPGYAAKQAEDRKFLADRTSR
jgi:hypothetical protein